MQGTLGPAAAQRLLMPNSLQNLQKWAAVFQSMKQEALAARARGQKYISLSKSAAAALGGRRLENQRVRSMRARSLRMRRLSAGAGPRDGPRDGPRRAGRPSSVSLGFAQRDASVVAQSLKLAKSVSTSVRAATSKTSKTSQTFQSAKSPDGSPYGSPDGFQSARGSPTKRSSPKAARPRDSIEASKAYYFATGMQVLLAVMPYVVTSAMTPEAADTYWVLANDDPDPKAPLIENLTYRFKHGLLDRVVGSVADKLPMELQKWTLQKYAEVKAGL
jgi:hypothetical protein